MPQSKTVNKTSLKTAEACHREKGDPCVIRNAYLSVHRRDLRYVVDEARGANRELI